MTQYIRLDETDFGIFFPEQNYVVSMPSAISAEAAIHEAQTSGITAIRLYVKEGT